MTHKPKIITIYSENSDYQKAEVLRKNRIKRSKNKKFFVEGVKSIELLIKNGWNIDTFLYSKKNRKSDWAKNILRHSNALKHFELPNKLLKKLSDKENTSEIIALVSMMKNDLSRIEIKKIYLL